MNAAVRDLPARRRRAREIGRRALESDPVFIVGVARSGTTALRNTLERLPAFEPRGGRSPETRIFARPERMSKMLDPVGETLLDYYLGDRERAREALELARALPAPRFARLRGLSPWQAGGHADRVRVFFDFAREARGVARILEKTPSHALHLEEIRSTFPLARVIACVRHPVDVYSSYRKRLRKVDPEERQGGRLTWLDADPEEFCRGYAETVRAILAAEEEDPSTILRLRYEDLTEDPARWLRALCEFIDEPYDEARLVDDVEVRRDEHGSPRLRARLAPNEKTWQEYLDPESAARIEETLAPWMERLGYEPLTCSEESATPR